MNVKAVAAPFFLLTLFSCSNVGRPDAGSAIPVKVKPPASNAGGQTVNGERITGKVLETMDSAGYTYVAVEVNPGHKVWAAARQTPIKIGDAIDVAKGTQMTNFTSRTLRGRVV